MRSRSWKWLRTRILGLLTRPQRMALTGDLEPANRLQASFAHPSPEQHRAQQ